MGREDYIKPEKGLLHSLGGARFSHWRRLLRDHGGVDPAFRGRAAMISCLTLMQEALRRYSARRFDREIERTPLNLPPLFIIGHWRSGTTFLHELLSCDPQLIYPTLWQAAWPESFLGANFAKGIFRRFLPVQRPMDGIRLDLDAPQEEELALGCLTRWSFMHALYFPRHAERQFRQGVLMQGLDQAAIDTWKERYLRFLRAVTFASERGRLILKNPAHTARLPLVLSLFPNAQFIHLVRNPYTVHASTVNMRSRAIARIGLQQVSMEAVTEQTLNDYSRLLDRFFQDYPSIASRNRVEVRFEDLEKDPLHEIERIYKTLGLTGFAEARLRFKQFLRGRASYRKNAYHLDTKTVDRVHRHCGAAINHWGYAVPD